MVTAIITGTFAAVVSGVLYAVTMLLTLHTSRLRHDVSAAIRWIMIGGMAVALVLAIVDTEVTRGLASMWFAVVLLVTIFVVVRRVLTTRVVDMQTIFGALSAYIMIGLAFAAIYGCFDHLSSAVFFAAG